MPTSDSEDFESADEGHGSPDKKERKKRLSSSNYSDNVLETEQKASNTKTSSSNVQKVVENVKEKDGWGDFEINNAEPVEPQPTASIMSSFPKPELVPSVAKETQKSQDTGWDNFEIDAAEPVKPQPTASTKSNFPKPELVSSVAKETQKSQGSAWDDFEIDAAEPVKPQPTASTKSNFPKPELVSSVAKETQKSQGSAWDDFEIDAAEPVKPQPTASTKSNFPKPELVSSVAKETQKSQGSAWDDFEIDAAEPVKPQPTASTKSNFPKPELVSSVAKETQKSQDTAWDDFEIDAAEPVKPQPTASTKSNFPKPELVSSVAKETQKSQGSAWDDFEIDAAEPVKPQPTASIMSNFPKPELVSSVAKETQKCQDSGWDDFEIDPAEPVEPQPTASIMSNFPKPELVPSVAKEDQKSQGPGWDEFDDWRAEDASADVPKAEPPIPQPAKPKPITTQPAPNIQEVTDRMAAASAGGSSGWGWGWSVDSLLSSATAGFSSATAGISNITSQVSQGISTVLETGIGAPDPEELARRTSKPSQDQEPRVARPENVPTGAGDKITVVSSEADGTYAEANAGANAGDAFQFGSLFSGVTKFVESTGTKVIHGGLDTLETIGKKTMEVLQTDDPGLAKKRALLGLGSGDKPVLSQVLREAKAKAEEDDRVREEKREAKEVHYENLFDDFEGLVHLEALEMLSRQVSMRIEERIRSVDADKRQDIKETLQQVAELCEMPEEDEEDEESPSEDLTKSEAFLERLQTATQDLGLKLQFQPLVKQYKEILDYISTLESDTPVKAVYKRGVSTLAQSTALSVEQYHKAAEMLLVKARRSTADEADALTQMTVVLTKHISELATLFTEKLNALPADNPEQANTYITNIFLEAGNSSTYIQNAFQLALPILQIGAV